MLQDNKSSSVVYGCGSSKYKQKSSRICSRVKIQALRKEGSVRLIMNISSINNSNLVNWQVPLQIALIQDFLT